MSDDMQASEGDQLINPLSVFYEQAGSCVCRVPEVCFFILHH